jgi:histidine ammonia-lyase
LDKEVNAVTDNPNIFSESDGILTGGNFHAQPIGLISDFLAIAMSEVANISERRLYQLINGTRGLPSYLTQQAGHQSGFMIVQYAAASVVSHNKQLCTPSTVDSIVSSQGQEDHVSMAANASHKLYKVVENVERVLAMELLTAMQALDFRRPLKSSEDLEALYTSFRENVAFLDTDREMYIDMAKARSFIMKNPMFYLQ